MDQLRKLYLTAAFSVSALVFRIPVAAAQAQNAATPASSPGDPVPSDEGWHIGLTPYIWFAGVHGTVGVLGHDASVHASFSDVLSNVNIGAMGAVEARYNRVIIPVDFIWIKLSDEKALPFDVGVASVKAELNQTILTPKIGYRFIDEKKFKVDAVFGIRYWRGGNTFTLQPVQIGNGLSASANWVDAVAGAKFEVPLTPKLMVTVLGDAGGGSARSDYQVAGFLGLRLSKRWILQAGYRYLSVNYRPQGTFIYDVAQSGLLLGATFNLK
jgi:hypothetical protein